MQLDTRACERSVARAVRGAELRYLTLSADRAAFKMVQSGRERRFLSCQGRAPQFAPRTRFHRLQAIHSTGHSLGVSLMRISLIPVISLAFKAGNGSRCVERALAEAFTPRSEAFATVSAGALRSGVGVE